MKNKNFTRFLCFFVCFCLCFAWFGPPIEAKAVGALPAAWIINAIIAFMAAYGVTTVASGSMDSAQTGVQGNLKEWLLWRVEQGLEEITLADFFGLFPCNTSITQTGHLMIASQLGQLMISFMDWLLNVRMVDEEADEVVYDDISCECTKLYFNGIEKVANVSTVSYGSSDGYWIIDSLGSLFLLTSSYLVSMGDGYVIASIDLNDGSTCELFSYDISSSSITLRIRKIDSSSSVVYTSSSFVQSFDDSGIIYIGLSNDTTYNNYFFSVFTESDENYISRRSSVLSAFTPAIIDNVTSSASLERIDTTNTLPSPDNISNGITINTGDVTGDSVETLGENIGSAVLTGTLSAVGELEGSISGDTEVDSDAGILEWLRSIWEAIKALPSSIGSIILDGIKSIFIPDPDDLNNQFMALLDEINEKYSFNFDLDSLFGSSKEPDDITAVYAVGDHQWSLTFVSWYYLKKAVETFRPYIRGFIVLMLIFYNLKQFMALFGLGGIIDGSTGEALKAWYGVGEYGD